MRSDFSLNKNENLELIEKSVRNLKDWVELENKIYQVYRNTLFQSVYVGFMAQEYDGVSYE